MTSVIIAEAVEPVRHAWRFALESADGLAVAGEAVDLAGLLALLGEKCPDGVLLCWELPGIDQSTASGIDVIDRLRRHCTEVRVIVTSSSESGLLPALAVGAEGFISKLRLREVDLDVLIALFSRRETAEATARSD